MQNKKILVLGAGVMGLGISQAAAQKGFEVYLKDVDKNIAKKGILKIEASFQKLLDRGKILKKEMKKNLSLIHALENEKSIKGIDFIIEAVAENTIIKKRLIKEIDKFRSNESIFASNTTSLSITDLASATDFPERFIGMHFFNPVWAMKLIEITPGIKTSKDTIEKTKVLANSIGKTAIVLKESTGGIVSRITGTMINEAVFAFAEGVASAEDIDMAIKLGANLPIGPLHLIDLIGLDIHLAKMETLYNEFGDSKYRPHPLLRRMVRAGYLGKKSGQGFFKY